MNLLSGGVEYMKASLPHPGSGGNQDTDASRLLRGLMEEVFASNLYLVALI